MSLQNDAKIVLVILTHNAMGTINEVFAAVERQTLQPNNVIVVDSSSSDGTLTELKKYRCQVTVIPKAEFDHGTTRKFASQLVAADIYIYLTQDAIPANEYAFANLIKAFDDPKVGCVYGRQLPKSDANILGSHVRLHYYPETSSVMTYADRKKYGIMTCFSSDSFAAYRSDALHEIGGFPENTILCEDMYVAAKMLMQGWKKAYQADAMVFHSHNYSILQNFKFTFDIGVFHAMNPWIRQNFPGIQWTGAGYALSEYKHCLQMRQYKDFIKSIFNISGKYLGYILGLHYKLLPIRIRKKISLCSFYWNQK